MDNDSIENTNTAESSSSSLETISATGRCMPRTIIAQTCIMLRNDPEPLFRISSQIIYGRTLKKSHATYAQPYSVEFAFVEPQHNTKASPHFSDFLCLSYVDISAFSKLRRITAECGHANSLVAYLRFLALL